MTSTSHRATNAIDIRRLYSRYGGECVGDIDVESEDASTTADVPAAAFVVPGREDEED